MPCRCCEDRISDLEARCERLTARLELECHDWQTLADSVAVLRKALHGVRAARTLADAKAVATQALGIVTETTVSPF